MLIFGWQKRIHTLVMITLVCGRCGNPAAHALRKLVTKFTLFFIPLIPLSTKHYLECTWCGAKSPIAAPPIPAQHAPANPRAKNPPPSAPRRPHP
ncbi:zinc-ribbon domain-containing protein, partial [Nocardia abscessus]|uniref:zinc-ribbon domain-containing protein n=1 Tax=Nocardia abscessus TaxID=120957 RepID=UPI002454972D